MLNEFQSHSRGPRSEEEGMGLSSKATSSTARSTKAGLDLGMLEFMMVGLTRGMVEGKGGCSSC